jgi:hypothetical protein
MVYIDTLRERMSKVRHGDQALKEFKAKEKAKEKEDKRLELFMK